MPNLKEIVKVTPSQMETLLNGGTISGHKLSDDVLYAVEGAGAPGRYLMWPTSGNVPVWSTVKVDDGEL